MTIVNTLELTRARNGHWLARIDGCDWPGNIDLRTLAATVGRSDRYHIWPDQAAVIVDQVSDGVRWKVWTDRGWHELWFSRQEYEATIRLACSIGRLAWSDRKGRR